VIYLDSNIFIYPLVYGSSLEETKKANLHLGRLVRGKISGCTSILTWDEVFYVVYKITNNRKSARLAGEMFLVFPNLCHLSVDFGLVAGAQEIAAKFDIKPRDAIHAACALEFCDGEIISNDSDFDRIDGMTRRF